MWPFSKKPRFPGVKENADGTIDFTLTDDEARKADLALQTFKGLLVHPEVADKVRNGTIAVALSHYANELISTDYHNVTKSEFNAKWPTIQRNIEKAVAAVWKSYSLNPLPVFLYQRAVFLQSLGMKDQSRQIFSLFILKQLEFQADDVDKALMSYEGTDIERALTHARSEA
jgi:hypothetical protein